MPSEHKTTVDQLWREMEGFISNALEESAAITTEAGESRIINRNEKLYSSLRSAEKTMQTLKQLHSNPT